MTPTALRIRTATAAAALVAAAALAGPPAVSAATTPVVTGTTLTLTGDDAADRVTIADNGTNLTISVNGGAASTDFGGQTLPIDNSIDLVFNAGGGDDEITIATANLKSVTADGGAGDDILTGNLDKDALSGGDGDDRVIGGRGDDTMAGGAGNDVLVWNNGDGNDRMDGDGNADEIEVNGAPSQGDQFLVQPNPAEAGRVRFDRLNLGLFNLNISAERITVNGLGGNDTVTGQAGLAPLIAMTANGGPGEDALSGGDGADLLNGGDDNDTLTGGGRQRRPAPDAGAERGVHAADLRGVRGLRPVRRFDPHPRHLAAEGAGLDAPHLRRRLRGARRQARARRALAAVRRPRPSCGWPRGACRPAPRRRRSPDGSGPSAWRSAAPACRRARCWARRC